MGWEMAQQGKVLTAKPDNLGSVPRSHNKEGENQLLQAGLCPPQVFHGVHAHANMHAHTNQ